MIYFRVTENFIRGRGEGCLRLYCGTFHRFSPPSPLPSPSAPVQSVWLHLFPLSWIPTVSYTLFISGKYSYSASVLSGCCLISPSCSPLVCSAIIRQVVQGDRNKLLLEKAAGVGQLVWLATAGLERKQPWKIGAILLTIPPLVFPVKWQSLLLSSVTSKGDTKIQRWVHLMLLASHSYSAPSRILKYFTWGVR